MTLVCENFTYNYANNYQQSIVNHAMAHKRPQLIEIKSNNIINGYWCESRYTLIIFILTYCL